MANSEINNMVPIAAALIASLSTLLGVLIANRHNIKSTKLSLQFAHDQKMYELRLEKLEYLYFLFEKWHNDLSKAYLLHLRAYAGHLSYDQVLKLFNKQCVSENNEYQKIQMLVNVYFPALRTEYQKVLDKRDSLSKYLHDPDKNKLTAKEFSDEQEQFDLVCNEFKDKLSGVQNEL